MENYYEILGLKNSATGEEIRRAYRVLARRYHPDVNPGRASEDRFKKISHAYGILSDPKKKESFDRELEAAIRSGAHRGFRAYEKMHRETTRARDRFHAQSRTEKERSGPKVQRRGAQPASTRRGSLSSIVEALRERVARRPARPSNLRKSSPPMTTGPRKVSLIETSLTIRDAVYGAKRTVELAEPEGVRKISVSIPPGSRHGSIVRLVGKSASEELILVIRIATHPILSIHTRGLVAEVPITVTEAIMGASITVPTLEDQMVIKIPTGCQSGHEIRLAHQGLFHKDGSRGDLFIRVMIQVPPSPEAVGLKELVGSFEQYYGGSPRQHFPKTLLEP